MLKKRKKGEKFNLISKKWGKKKKKIKKNHGEKAHSISLTKNRKKGCETRTINSIPTVNCKS